MGVLADDHMGQQLDPLTDRRQMLKAGKRDLRQVADAVYTDDNLRRPGLGQFTIQKSDHVEL